MTNIINNILNLSEQVTHKRKMRELERKLNGEESGIESDSDESDSEASSDDVVEDNSTC